MPSDQLKICVSLLPESHEQLEKWLPECKDADLLELRLDLFPSPDFKRIRKLIDKPLIVTARSKTQGGFWQGSEQQRANLYWSALESGIDYLDMEWQLAHQLLPLLDFPHEKMLVLSHHTEISESSELLKIFEQMLMIEAFVYKLVFRANRFEDNAAALRLADFAKERGIGFIIHAMGEAGKTSRLSGAVLGNQWTYTALSPGTLTAPGQITLNEVTHEYFLAEKSTSTKLVGLLGYPIGQSPGWRLHNRLLRMKRKQLLNSKNSPDDFLYVNFPSPDFSKFWQAWQSRVSGLSITMPHKETIIPALNKISPAVKISGVCNTAIKRNGKWWGFNTDFLAMLKLLKPHLAKLENGMLIIGTGATARSAIGVLQQLGIRRIFITGRNMKRGDWLQKKYGIQYLLSDALNDLQPGSLIQTTPVGMFPNSQEIPEVTGLFREGMLVFDVIYNPPLTRFLRTAQERGCQIISGMEMFLNQAALQFEVFSGIRVEMTEIREVSERIRPPEVDRPTT